VVARHTEQWEGLETVNQFSLLFRGLVFIRTRFSKGDEQLSSLEGLV